MLHECCLLTYAAHAAVIRWTHGTLFLLDCGVSVLWECAGQWGGSGCARACVRVPPTHEPSVCTVSSLCGESRAHVATSLARVSSYSSAHSTITIYPSVCERFRPVAARMVTCLHVP